jgi:hypothetical protein
MHVKKTVINLAWSQKGSDPSEGMQILLQKDLPAEGQTLFEAMPGRGNSAS